MVAIFVVVVILVVIATLPRLVARIENICSRQHTEEAPVVPGGIIHEEIKVRSEEFTATAKLPQISLVEARLTCKCCGGWGAEEGPAGDLCPECMQRVADEQEPEGQAWDCGLGGHIFGDLTDEFCSKCGDHVGAMEAVETERCFECYAPVTGRVAMVCAMTVVAGATPPIRRCGTTITGRGVRTSVGWCPTSSPA